MSYEGFTQFLCEAGHYWSLDCYESENKNCPTCGNKPYWTNSVDTTNGSYCDVCNSDYPLDSPCQGCEYCDNGRIDGYVELEILEEAKKETCPCCKNTKVVEPVRYKIPLNKGRLI